MKAPLVGEAASGRGIGDHNRVAWAPRPTRFGYAGSMVLLLLACHSDPPCEPVSGYRDEDGDGWGGEAATDCPSVLVDRAGDCDDADAGVHPEAAEVCDAADIDEDCDTLADDADPDATGQAAQYTDVDLDGHGVEPVLLTACDGGAPAADDCDDADATVFPGAPEACDGVDTDCDSATGEDGLGTWRTATSIETFTELGDRALDEEGDLQLCAGTWEGSLVVTASVTVTGAGADLTSITGDGTIVRVDAEKAWITVQDLTLSGGAGSTETHDGRLGGGALACSGAATVTVEDVDFRDNTAALGGAIASDGCTMYVWRGVMTGNTAEEGGAVWVRDGHVELSRLDMTDNTASSRGGAVASEPGRSGAFLVLGDALLTGNSAPIAGAVSLVGDVAMHCYGTGRDESGFYGNSSESGGVVTTDHDSGIEFVLCDTGLEGTEDDNTPIDVTTSAGDYSLGDDLTAWCYREGCAEL